MTTLLRLPAPHYGNFYRRCGTSHRYRNGRGSKQPRELSHRHVAVAGLPSRKPALPCPSPLSEDSCALCSAWHGGSRPDPAWLYAARGSLAAGPLRVGGARPPRAGRVPVRPSAPPSRCPRFSLFTVVSRSASAAEHVWKSRKHSWVSVPWAHSQQVRLSLWFARFFDLR